METITNACICKSVFKNGTPPTMSEFTKKWIEMVNSMEKSKQFVIQEE